MLFTQQQIKNYLREIDFFAYLYNPMQFENINASLMFVRNLYEPIIYY